MTEFQKLKPEQYRKMSLQEIADTLPEGWWVAVDGDQELWAHHIEPYMMSVGWNSSDCRKLCQKYHLNGQDWKTTKTKSSRSTLAQENLILKEHLRMIVGAINDWEETKLEGYLPGCVIAEATFTASEWAIVRSYVKY